MSAHEPSTPVRQQGKRLCVQSPGSAVNQAVVGVALRSLLDSPAVSPPQGPGVGGANPHLHKQQQQQQQWGRAAEGGASTADLDRAAAGAASSSELLRRAEDSLSTDPDDIMKEEIMAEARRSLGYLQQLRDERAEHRRWFVEVSEQHAVGRKLAAQQLSRQRKLRALASCFSALRVRVDQLARQHALAGWGDRTRRQQLRATWGHWARRAAHWYRLARAYELTTRREWCRVARAVLRDWRRNIVCSHRNIVAGRRAELRRLRCWFEQWAGQSRGWASIHRDIERSSRLALRRLEYVSRKAIRYEHNCASTCARAWRTWCHRRVVARRLLARYRMHRSCIVKIAVLRAWRVFVVQHCRHTALAWHAVSVGRRLHTSLRHWRCATHHRLLHRARTQALLVRAASCSRSRALAGTVYHLKQHATRQLRCRRLLQRIHCANASKFWHNWYAVIVYRRRRQSVVNRAGMKRRQHTLSTCLLGWCRFKHYQCRARDLAQRSVRNSLRRRLHTWFVNMSTRRLEDALEERNVALANHRAEIGIRLQANRKLAALSRCLYTWHTVHERCKHAQEQRQLLLKVMQAKQCRVALRSTLVAWRHAVESRYAVRQQHLRMCMTAWSGFAYSEKTKRQHVASTYKRLRCHQRSKLAFSLWRLAIAEMHRVVSIVSKVAGRDSSRRVQFAFKVWSQVLIERTWQRMQDQWADRLSNVHNDSRKRQASLRVQMANLASAKSSRSRRYIILSLTLGHWQRSTRASLRDKIPLLHTAFEIERIALLKGSALSADADRQAQVSKLEDQRRAERTQSAQLLIEAEVKVAELEGKLHACAVDLRRMKEKYRCQQSKWKKKWDGFEHYRAEVRRKEVELAQKKEALREWSQHHMGELRQFIEEHHAEKQSCSRAMEAAQQLECAAAEIVAAKDHELSFAKCAAATARREQAEVKDQLVATRALFSAASTTAYDTVGVRPCSKVPNSRLRTDRGRLVTATGGGLVQSDKVIAEVLSRSTEELVSIREEEEEAALSLDYDIQCLIGELKMELRLAE
eukprot:COSAG02_NODE_4955_length_4782_cov_5.866752_2_plen_1034_part_00